MANNLERRQTFLELNVFYGIGSWTGSWVAVISASACILAKRSLFNVKKELDFKVVQDLSKAYFILPKSKYPYFISLFVVNVYIIIN